MLKTRLYLAGPMRGYKDFNFPAFIEATKKLREAGYIVSCPAEMDRADGFNEEVLARMSDKEVMEYTRRVFPRDAISVCGSDGIALLDGWSVSKGASAEVAIANAMGIPCRPVVGWLNLAEIENTKADEKADGNLKTARECLGA